MAIKTILFDFGGVLINLEIPKTIAAFNAITRGDFSTLYTQAEQNDLFNRFDKGLISEKEFFETLAELIGYSGPSKPLYDAWNAMLLDLPAERLNLLLRLKKNYRTFLLSNTCETHISAFEKEMQQVHHIHNLSAYFEKVYYSCRIGMRKPDREIFEFVLRENNLIAEETVFIDDSQQHVSAAASLGIQAHLLPPGVEIQTFLKDLKLI